MPMIRTCFLISIAVVWSVVMSGCSTSPTDSVVAFESTLYVEGFLQAGKPVDSIFVSTTAPLYEIYDREQNAVPAANVTISRGW